MLPLNAYVIKGRGHALNWGVDFRGGSEILIEFSRPVDAGAAAQDAARARASHDADVVKYEDPTGKTKWNYLVRRRRGVGASPRSRPSRSSESLAKEGDATLHTARVVRGRRQDLPALRQAGRAVVSSPSSLKAIGVSTQQVQPLRPRRGQHLRGDPGQPRQRDPARASTRRSGRGPSPPSPRSSRSAPRRASSCRSTACESLLYAILLIMVYIAVPLRLPLRPRARSSRCCTTR